ncbi:MAG TPA: glutamate ABC transporter substrate-binding protein [Actinomycetaceae bacterium]|nr:glutamate ABC transporter substrate-binding protein [Actinomycetaceae bacterium]
MRNRLIAASAIAVLGLTLAACGNGDDDGANGQPAGTATGATDGGAAGGDLSGETITIGIKYDQPGLGLQEGADFTGFDVDVAKYVVEYMGYDPANIEWVESISANRETMLENGQVDMIFATYSITDARAERVDFAGPYFIAGQDLLVRQDEMDITGPDALTDRILCSVEGSTSAERIRDEHPGVELYPAATYSECVELLTAQTVDAVTTDDIILAGFANQDAFAGELKVVGNTFSTENYGVGLPMGSTDTCEQVNEAIQAMIDDGSWEQALADNAGEDYQYNTEVNPPETFECR